MLVRAKCNHLEPPQGTYRMEGEEFDTPSLYKHVEAVEVATSEPVEEEVEPRAKGKRRKLGSEGE